MDPDLAFDDFALARREGRWADARDHARDLREWLRSGGFVPEAMRQENRNASRDDLVAWLATYEEATT